MKLKNPTKQTGPSEIIKLELLPASMDLHQWCKIRIVTTEYVWVIDLIFTAYGSTQVCLHEEWDDSGYLCNWCGGRKEHDILNLVNSMICIIDRDQAHKAPHYCRHKPYYRDEAFCQFIAPFNKKYFRKISKLWYSRAEQMYFTVLQGRSMFTGELVDKEEKVTV